MNPPNLIDIKSKFRFVKLLFTMFLGLISSNILAQETVNQDTVVSYEGKTKMLTIKQNGKPFKVVRLISGRKNGWQEVYHPNGKLAEKAMFRSGFPDGEKHIYDFRGNLLEISTLKFNKAKGHEVLEGKFESYSNGKLTKRCYYKDSLLEGEFSQYSQDFIVLKATYKAGLIKGKQVKYNPRSGKLLAEENYSITSVDGKLVSLLNGFVVYYNYEGNISQTGFYELGKKTGEWVKYHNDGKTFEQKQNYKNGFEYGSFANYYYDGQLQRSGALYKDIMVDGKKLSFALDGEIREFYENGKLKKQEFYKMGNRIGKFSSYYENGQKQEVGEYKSNLKTGCWEYWNTDGTLVRSQNFKIIKQDSILVSVQDGLELTYQNGVLNSEVNWREGKKHGEQKTYYADGILASRMNFENGNIKGQYAEYYKNGNLKLVKNYDYIQRYDGSYSSETKEVGLLIQYEENGAVKGKWLSDERGATRMSASYKNGRNLNFQLNDLLNLNYNPDGQIRSVAFKGSRNQTLLELYYYRDGSLRKIAFQNPETAVLNYVDFASNGEIINLYSDIYHNPDSLFPSPKIAKQYAQAIGMKFIENPFFTDLVKNGIYKLTYTNGKPLAIISFKDDLPDGKWLVFDALTGDTLMSKNFENGASKGPFMQKFAGKNLIFKGEAVSDYLNLYFENYRNDGTPVEKMIYDEKGQVIYKAEYYDDGKLKILNDKSKGVEIHYFMNGNISLEYLKNADTTTTRSYFENGQLRDVKRNKSGKHYGFMEEYYETGRLKYKIYFVEGKRQGEYLFYNEDGGLRTKGFFKDDKPEGEWVVTDNNKKTNVLYKEGIVQVQAPKYDCGCVDTLENYSKISFIPTLHGLVEFEKAKTFLPQYIVAGDETNYNSIFYRNFYPSGGSRDYNSSSLELVMFDPVAIRFPADEQLRLTFNPCETFGYISKMPVNVYYNSRGLISADFETKKVKLEFLKGPVRSADPNHEFFSAYLSTNEVSYKDNKMRIEQGSAGSDCFSKAIIKNFLNIDIQSVEFYNKERNYAYNDYLKSDELAAFYGLEVHSAILSFILDSPGEIRVEGRANMLLLGGKFASGVMAVECTRDDSGNLFVKTERGNQIIDLELIKLQWLRNGFTRLDIRYDEVTGFLKIKFFVE